MSDKDKKTHNTRHDSRISRASYEQQVVALYRERPPILDKQAQFALRRREFDLTIDHRLGLDFPPQRREALWNIQQKIEKKRLRLALWWLVKIFSSRLFYGKANQIGDFAYDEYAKVLTKEELQMFFELKENERPVLPLEKH